MLRFHRKKHTCSSSTERRFPANLLHEEEAILYEGNYLQLSYSVQLSYREKITCWPSIGGRKAAALPQEEEYLQRFRRKNTCSYAIEGRISPAIRKKQNICSFFKGRIIAAALAQEEEYLQVFYTKLSYRTENTSSFPMGRKLHAALLKEECLLLF